MYFQVHLTTYPFEVTKRADFQKACTDLQTRFTFIELAKGETKMQPMATFISFEPYPQLLERIIRLNFHFHTRGFPISRSKIQYPFDFYEEVKTASQFRFVYFETHLKVKFDETHEEELRTLGKKYQAHLSTNSLANKRDEKFLTYRQYEEQPEKFTKQIDSLSEQLSSSGFEVKKIIREVAIYDSNERVDHGWLV